LKAVTLFGCVGLVFPGAAALINFESKRLMGPNIAGALSSLTPSSWRCSSSASAFAFLNCSPWPCSLLASA
jgi:hypothetical protein